jgi:hypothetical protein
VVWFEVETGVGAEPLPQERGQLVWKRVAHVGSARAGHVAGDLHEPKLPLPAIRQPHEHRPLGPTRLFIHRGQLQKRFAMGVEGHAQGVAAKSEPAVEGGNHGRESTADRDNVGPGGSNDRRLLLPGLTPICTSVHSLGRVAGADCFDSAVSANWVFA